MFEPSKSLLILYVKSDCSFFFSKWVSSSLTNFSPLKSYFYRPLKWETFLDYWYHCSIAILGLIRLYFSNSNFGEIFMSCETFFQLFFFFFWRFLASCPPFFLPIDTHTHTHRTSETFFQVPKKSYWDFSMNYFVEYEGKENLYINLA